MSETKPIIPDDPMYCLLREGKIDAFNARRAEGISPSLHRCDFRGTDLRGMNAAGLDFRGAYFRGADLRGLDLRDSDLRGASLAQAHISGVYFPPSLRAEEILMSVQHGTRLRYEL